VTSDNSSSKVTISEFKPFRDWLREILACSLGYFSFEFGKLKLGIRYSAIPTGAFTVANMLYQSLSLSPMESAFEYLKIDFANVALQYQQDMVEYQDKDHAAYYGRAGAPLTARQAYRRTLLYLQGSSSRCYPCARGDRWYPSR